VPSRPARPQCLRGTRSIDVDAVDLYSRRAETGYCAVQIRQIENNTLKLETLPEAPGSERLRLELLRAPEGWSVSNAPRELLVRERGRARDRRASLLPRIQAGGSVHACQPAPERSDACGPRALRPARSDATRSIGSLPPARLSAASNAASERWRISLALLPPTRTIVRASSPSTTSTARTSNGRRGRLRRLHRLSQPCLEG
jgi:hypothetical protein